MNLLRLTTSPVGKLFTPREVRVLRALVAAEVAARHTTRTTFDALAVLRGDIIKARLTSCPIADVAPPA